MNNHMEWINRKVRWGWLSFAAALVVAAIGIALEWQVKPQSFNPKYVTSLGIIMFGVGIAYLQKYFPARRNPQAAARMAAKANDERVVAIRAKAGFGAYILSAVLTYAGMMWVGGAERRGEPLGSADAIWYGLLVLFLLPICFFVISLLYYERNR